MFKRNISLQDINEARQKASGYFKLKVVASFLYVYM